MDIKIVLNKKEFTVAEGTKLSALVHSDMPCGGHGKCGKCKVVAKGNISPLTDTEKKKLTTEEIQNDVRLACMTFITGNCEVTTEDLPAENNILTNGNLPYFELNPIFKQYGIAIDIGTTTLAARLYDKNGNILAEDSRMNPQARFGADVISRIEAAMKGNGKELTEAITKEISAIISSLAKKANVQTSEIDKAVITGNTTMLHLLTETDVSPLSKAPFEAKRLFGEMLTAKDLKISTLSTNTNVYLTPCISAFLGADTVCAILASDMKKTDGIQILADIGTNGEMALSKNGELTVCSTAAGPAFEGAGISMGMGGKTGAIDKAEVIDGEIKAHVIGNTKPVGICGSGLIDAIKCLLEIGVLDDSGYLEDNPAEIEFPVFITQEDIRKVQLAKSAIYAGIKTMLKTKKINLSDVERLYIAGGFGNFLNVNNAGKIGLLPEELTKRTTVLGNAALSGASMILLNGHYTEKAKEIAKRAKVLPLSSNPIFTEEYMEGMFF